MGKKIIITGASGSGKDYLANRLNQKGLSKAVKTTSRPSRVGETHGDTYYYTTLENFLERKDEFLFYQSFEINENTTWYYGLEQNEFDNSDIIILTPIEIGLLTTEQRKDCFIVYLCMDENLRRKRIKKRQDDNDSIERRITLDRQDFGGFMDYDLILRTPDYSIDDILSNYLAFV